MDGAPQSYTSGIKVLRTLNNGTYLLQIQGIKSISTTDEMDRLVYAPNEINTGDYVEGDHDAYYTLGVYAPQNRTDDLGIYFGGIHTNDAAPFKIKITEITDKYIKGTFSGTYYDNQGNGDNKKVITEGEFKAPLH